MLFALTVLPVAAALGLPATTPGDTPDAGPAEPVVQSVEAAKHAAEQAAGFGDSPPPVAPLDPLAPPQKGALVPPIAVVGVALAGLAGVAFSLFFSGGARFVTPAEVLANDVRQGIYGYLKDRVGANLKQITDDLSLTTTNAIWHLRKLEEAGLIHSRRFNGYKVFYPAEGGIEARRLSLGKTALANAHAQEVFEHVVSHPGTHQREIARALGVNHGTVRWHLKKLMSAEMIVESRKGKASAYEPTPIGLAALREVGRVHVPAAAPVPATPFAA
ncbi:MAG TPA: helix-turn-helix domain-containing protein [Candidatus Thermoplasmatota archaeon]|nr:helix-turn-helix domain-containing protein [Candidatus Thermoplasmatota archaeon]